MAEIELSEQAAGLVELMFEAPASPRGWERVLDALESALSPGAVPMLLGPVVPDEPPYFLGPGIPLRALSYDDLQPPEEHPPAEQVGVGTVFPIPPASEGFARTRLYRNVLGKEGFAPGPGFCVVLERDARQLVGGLMVLSRDSAWRPTERDRELLALLAPYLIRSVTVGLRLNERRSSIDALLGIFDSLVLGVVLLDAQGNVTFANQSAAELLGVGAGLAPADREHSAERRKRTEAMRALLRRETTSPCGALSFPHPEDGRPLYITTTPLAWKGSSARPDARFATALFIGDPGGEGTGVASALRQLYGLTPAEERVALALAAGLTVAECAKRLGIRVSTARSVLRTVFEKTETNRQPSLVRVVLTAVGQVRSEAPRG
jgi:DNA-binding CsgD family transcriptional regulator/PAS domain-containing protein